MTAPSIQMQILEPSQWQQLQDAHHQRAAQLLESFRHPGGYHPVYDFLFSYYPVRPSQLMRWHPGATVALADPQRLSPLHELRDYQLQDSQQGPVLSLDIDSWWRRRGQSALFMRDLMLSSRQRAPQFDCFGLHEWAMLYRSDAPRHDLPLRLGAAGTNAVVESHKLRCTHFDAFRFFTPPARPLNVTVLSRERQPQDEQCGCVHATMDLYKWAWKLGPIIPGELFLDSLELAAAARVLDMEASPYDCREWGFGVVAIETPEGKAEYVARQRALSQAAEPLRQRLIDCVNQAAALAAEAPGDGPVETRGPLL